MDTLPNGAMYLLALAYAFGFGHGLDPDHLITIDGLTRFNARLKPRLARWCGLLFSLGHGSVVLGTAIALSALARQWNVPQPLENIGTLISMVALGALGLANLALLVMTDPKDTVPLVGLKGSFFAKMRHVSHPAAIAAIGALFALSFDTMTQAALFALAATQLGGEWHAALLAIMFSLGMMTADSLNGFLMARLIRGADRISRMASRAMSLLVTVLSFLGAGIGVEKILSADKQALWEGHELVYGIAVVTLIVSTYVIAVRVARFRSRTT